MTLSPLFLVSCTSCQLLHAPLREDVAHPLCSRCALPPPSLATRPHPAPSRRRGDSARS